MKSLLTLTRHRRRNFRQVVRRRPSVCKSVVCRYQGRTSLQALEQPSYLNSPCTSGQQNCSGIDGWCQARRIPNWCTFLHWNLNHVRKRYIIVLTWCDPTSVIHMLSSVSIVIPWGKKNLKQAKKTHRLCLDMHGQSQIQCSKFLLFRRILRFP